MTNQPVEAMLKIKSHRKNPSQVLLDNLGLACSHAKESQMNYFIICGVEIQVWLASGALVRSRLLLQPERMVFG